MPQSPQPGDNLVDLWRKLVNNQVENGASHATAPGDNLVDLKRKAPGYAALGTSFGALLTQIVT